MLIKRAQLLSLLRFINHWRFIQVIPLSLNIFCNRSIIIALLRLPWLSFIKSFQFSPIYVSHVSLNSFSRFHSYWKNKVTIPFRFLSLSCFYLFPARVSFLQINLTFLSCLLVTFVVHPVYQSCLLSNTGKTQLYINILENAYRI